MIDRDSPLYSAGFNQIESVLIYRNSLEIEGVNIFGDKYLITIPNMPENITNNIQDIINDRNHTLNNKVKHILKYLKRIKFSDKLR